MASKAFIVSQALPCRPGGATPLDTSSSSHDTETRIASGGSKSTRSSRSRARSSLSSGFRTGQNLRFSQNNVSREFHPRQYASPSMVSTLNNSVGTSSSDVKSVESLRDDLAALDNQLLTIQRVLEYFIDKGLDAHRFSEGFQIATERRANLIKQLEQISAAPASPVRVPTPFVPRSASPVVARSASPVMQRIPTPIVRTPSPIASPTPATSPVVSIIAAASSPLVETSFSFKTDAVSVEVAMLDLKIKLTAREMAYQEEKGQDVSRFAEGLRQLKERRHALLEGIQEPSPASPVASPVIAHAASPLPVRSPTPFAPSPAPVHSASPVASPVISQVASPMPVRSPTPIASSPAPMASPVIAQAASPVPVRTPTPVASPVIAQPASPVQVRSPTPVVASSVPHSPVAQVVASPLPMVHPSPAHSPDYGYGSEESPVTVMAAMSPSLSAADVTEQALVMDEMAQLLADLEALSKQAESLEDSINALLVEEEEEESATVAFEEEEEEGGDATMADSLVQEEEEEEEEKKAKVLADQKAIAEITKAIISALHLGDDEIDMAVEASTDELVLEEIEAVITERRESSPLMMKSLTPRAVTPMQMTPIASPIPVPTYSSLAVLPQMCVQTMRGELSLVNRRMDLIQSEKAYYEQHNLPSSRFSAALQSLTEYRAALVNALDLSSPTPRLSAVATPVVVPLVPVETTTRQARQISTRVANMSREEVLGELSNVGNRLELIENEIVYYLKHNLDASRYITGRQAVLDYQQELLDVIDQ
mmetsp:Transcript_36278/g.58624  ORF Transcript_36278/g.58624 Transcript_36278/m.58624 type:complete len:769 (-) Transcript_36278:743-3049(-)